MLYSIGYATKDLSAFLQQLEQHNITAVADVRSVPYSKAFFDFHQPALASSLKACGIHYVYLGEELGPRSKNPEHYDSSGQVQFERLQQSALFQQGIRRLTTGLDKGLQIALLCAEKDPAVCHRSLLISEYLLDRQQLEVQHICHGGELESQSVLRQRLVTENRIVPDMLTPACECEKMAWRAHSKRFAYRRP
ncbi:DUF488 domain-containing protein [Spongiibacter taiwanensis]|uniref:DUF488 domain-containing protein n=1 Tax=Spongiibacter taiwanensis TaxID=1748242 RepID=UPI00203656A7|nr:DUF488 domain-containing protein [Spongiibacter taiwanensis]USA43890.1 DUF488 domain-containing protein [Spongiibacter taiwanensis]